MDGRAGESHNRKSGLEMDEKGDRAPPLIPACHRAGAAKIQSLETSTAGGNSGRDLESKCRRAADSFPTDANAPRINVHSVFSASETP